MATRRFQVGFSVSLGMVLAAATAVVGGCSGTADTPQVDVQLYGWAPNDGQGTSFVGALENYPDADELRVAATRPAEDEVLSTKRVSVDQGKVDMPEVSAEEGVRLDFDLIGAPSGAPTRVGSAATPTFTVDGSTSERQFRAMLAPPDTFAPAYSQFASGSGDGSSYDYVRTTFDDRAVDAYRGRFGHRAVRTGGGDVLVVGGGPVSGEQTPGESPKLGATFADVQRFRAGVGYVDDIGYDPEEGTPRIGDRLQAGRALHTLTRVDPKKFVVIGGFSEKSGTLETVESVAMIDLTKQADNRVRRLQRDGNAVTLETPRARHTATYLSGPDQVVVAGGVDRGGNPVDSIEILDLSEKRVASGPTLSTARAQHLALKMGEGDGASVWLVGGRNGSGSVATTEVLSPGNGSYDRSSGGTLGSGRYHLDGVAISSEVAVVCGGYTEVGSNGSPSRSCEVGSVDQGRWSQSFRLPGGRGGADVVPMPRSRDLLVVGGRDAAGETATEALRLSFQGRDASRLYEVRRDVGSLHTSRYAPTATRLESGRTLLTGGVGYAKSSGEERDECRRGDDSGCMRSTLESFEVFNPGGSVVDGP